MELNLNGIMSYNKYNNMTKDYLSDFLSPFNLNSLDIQVNTALLAFTYVFTLLNLYANDEKLTSILHYLLNVGELTATA